MTPADLKKWREKHGYTQQALADALNVQRVTVSRWEREEGDDKREIPSFLGLALEALECRRGEKKKRESKRKEGR